MTDPVVEKAFLTKRDGEYPVEAGFHLRQPERTIPRLIRLQAGGGDHLKVTHARNCFHRRSLGPLARGFRGHRGMRVAESRPGGLALLRRHEIDCLCDVRSHPYSRNPQFNRENLMRDLKAAGTSYVFLGTELGARSTDPACYDHGKVRYDKLAQTELFRRGISRLTGEAAQRRVALMCAEKDPLERHRTIPIAPHILAAGFDVQHILADGSLESHADALGRLRRQLDLPEYDLFQTEADVIEDACRIQASKIAFVADRAAQAVVG